MIYRHDYLHQKSKTVFRCRRILVRLLITCSVAIINTGAAAQGFFYCVYEIPVAGQVHVYKALLTIQTDGTAIARVQYNAGERRQLYLYEIALADSAHENARGSTRYLVPSGAAIPLVEVDNAGFAQPRFLFQKKQDTSGYYYEPAGVDCLVAEKWISAKLTTMQLKTAEELRNDEPFVSAFYFDTDIFYQHLFAEHTRAVPVARTEKLFLFVVANTNDSTMGASAATDLKNVSGLFTKLARDLGITKVYPVYISGNNYSRQAVESALGSLELQRPAAKDIVVFYFSGHGFRLQGDKSIYPRMSFRTPKNKANKEVGENIPLEDVYDKITRLKPGVTLVLGDCCNADIFENPVLGNDMIRPKGGGALGTFNPASAAKLFFPPAPVSIIVGSVKQGHLSLGHPQIGGYFTHFFTAQLEKSLWGYYSAVLGSFQGKSSASWLRMLVTARQDTYGKSLRKQCGKTERDRCIQEAAFGVYPPQ